MARPLGIPHTDEWKKAQSIRLRKKYMNSVHHMKGTTRSEEVKLRTSNSCKKWIKENGHPCKGKKPSLESRMNKSKALKGKKWSDKRRKAEDKRQATYKKKWLNYGSADYHPDWTKIRKLAYERDCYTCQECGCLCQGINRQKIQCHHIDYNTKNNELSNLITLCLSCHSRTHWKREEWEEHYKKMMNGIVSVQN